MWMGNLKVAAPAILLAVAALALSACGSSGKDPTVAKPPRLPVATAERLARLSDQIASDLDAGETCSAAYAADELSSAVQSARLPSALRPGIDGVARRLVDEVNCPPPPPPPPAEKKSKKQPDHGHGNDHGNGGDPKPPGHGGKLPPGQAKLKGEPN